MRFPPLLIAVVFSFLFAKLYAASPVQVQQFINHKDWSFVENKGQLADDKGQLQPEIKYYGRQGGVSLYCKPGMLSFLFTKVEKAPENISEASGLPVASGHGHTVTQQPSTVSTSRTDLILIGSNPNAQVIASDQQEYYENFYLAHTPEAGITYVHTFKTITYKEVYPHIDMVLNTASQGMEYSFIVHPGGKVSDIQLQWNGVAKTEQLHNGGMKYENALGNLQESAPKSFVDGKGVESHFAHKGAAFGFSVGKYDKGRDLVIDPYIKWGSYFGGSNDEQILNIQIDSSKFIYFTGYTASASGIATSGAYQTSMISASDVMIGCFSTSGNLLWCTYYGGNAADYGNAINIDKNRNIIVLGRTNSTTGVATSGAFQTNYGGGNFDILIAKFSNSGSRIWSSYYGGIYEDDGVGVTTDTAGNILFSGSTKSQSGIATSGAFLTHGGVGTGIGSGQPFFVKFTSSGNRTFGSYFGWDGDNIEGIQTDISENIYFTGYTTATGGIATSGAFQTSMTGSIGNSYIQKFSSSGTRTWGTYYGGNTFEVGTDLKLDANNNIYLVGYTTSSTGIATSGAFQTSNASPGTAQDVFLAKFSNSGSRIWGTYFGGSKDDFGRSLVISKNNNIFITGYTASTSNIASPGGFQKSIPSSNNTAIVAKFSSNGNRIWSSYLGTKASTYGQSIVVDSQENIFIAGNCTSSSGGIVTSGAYQTSFGGSTWDGFISKISNHNYDAGVNAIVLPGGSLCSGLQLVKAQIANYGIRKIDSLKIGWTINRILQTPVKFTGTLKPDSFFTVNLGSASFPSGSDTIFAWTYLPNGIVDSFANNDSSNIILTINPSPNLDAGGNKSICNGTSVVLGRSSITGHKYSWTSNPLGFTSTSANPTVNPTLSTSYYLSETITATGCSANDTEKITVNAIPKSSFSINNSSQCLSGNNLSFTDKSTISSGAITVWAWDFGDLGKSVSQNPTHSYLTSGTFTVKLVVTNAGICKDSTSQTITVYPQPVSSFIIDNAAHCLTGNAFSFTDKSTISSGSITSWAWDFGDTKTSTSQNPSHSYTTSGTFTIKLVVTSNNGCKDSTTKTVTVYPQPASAFSINTAAQCLTSNSFVFTDNSTVSSGSISSWAWDFGDTKSSTSQSPSHSYTSAGTYTVKLTVTTNNSCTDNISKTVTVYPQPASAFSINTAAQCLTSNSFGFTDASTVSTGSIASWAWDFGDTKSSTSQSPSHTYTSAGTYTVKLTVTTNNGCTDNISKTVTVYPQPVSAFSINTAAQCLTGNSFSFTDGSTVSSGSIVSWAWDFGDSKSSTSQNPTHSYTSAGTYAVKLTVTTNGGCTDNISKSITVYPQSAPSFTINNSGQCLTGNSFAFTDATTISSGSISNWAWDFGDLASSTSQNPSHSYSAAGGYSVKLTVTSNNGCTDVVSKVINVYPLPVSSFSINSTAQCLIGNSFGFTDHSTVSTGSISSWAWRFGDLNTSTSQNPSHSFGAAGVDTIKLMATTNNGCTDISSKTITVYSKPTAGFTVNTNAECFPGNSFSFTDISTVSSGSIHGWAWDFGDGNSSSTQSPSHSYSTPGTFKVLLTATSDNGCTDTFSRYLTVYPKLTAGFGVNNSTQCLTGNNFAFSDISTVSAGSISNWQYDFGDPASGSSNVAITQNASHTYASTGTYTVKLKITSDKGCFDSIMHTIVVNAMPAANPGVNHATCYGTATNIGASSVSGSVYAWTSKPSGFVSALAQPSASPIATTTYYLAETISATGCSKSDSVIISVNPLPKAIPGLNKTICPGNGVTLGVEPISGNTYSWTSIPTGFSSTSSNPSVHPTSNTKYYLTEAITATGCSKTDSVIISIDTACKGYMTLEMDSSINTFDTLKVKVYVNAATNIYSLYSRLEINPDIFKLVSSKPGNFLGSAIINSPAVENAGYVDFGITKSGTHPGSSGSGLFYSFTFVVKDSFPTTDIKSLFSLDSIIAYDNTGARINVYDSAGETVDVHARVYVWPGDLNNDKKVDVADILPIGYFYNVKGPKRSSSSLSWTSQPAPFWGYDKSTKSKKGWAVFADADGNGTVGLADQAAIGLNIGKSHSKQGSYTPPILPAHKAGDPDLAVAFADTLILSSSLPKTITVPVTIGSTAVPISKLNGVAFNLFFDPKYMDGATLTLDYSNSIFGSENSDFIKQEDMDLSNGRIGIGLTRFNNATLNGHGTIVNLVFTIPANAPEGYFKMFATVIQAADSNGKDISINSNVDSVRIGKMGGVIPSQPDDFSSLNIFPNPFQTSTTVTYNLLKPSKVRMELLDITGKEIGVLSNEIQAPGNHSMEINPEKYGLKPGVYILKLMSGDGEVSRHIVKL